VAETLAKLQLPPDPDPQHHIADASSVVPLPKKPGQPGTNHHQLALRIREGRKAARQLAADMSNAGKGGGSSKETSISPPTDTMTSVSAVLEQDFTVEGKKGPLDCPFSSIPETVESPRSVEGAGVSHELTGTTADPTPHKSSDPICVAMLEETTSVPAPAASKCPIRFLDKHSPEEIAHYVETHKHEIPRSHEVCVRRYQKNEEQIRKLDAKYGNLVNMISDLSQLHRPMLPSAVGEEVEEVDNVSNKRVENWAQTVTPSDPEQADEAPVDEDRESHFDRPLRDVRVGESPSRPWGISVPLAANFHAEAERPASPCAAPVTMHGPPRTPKEPGGPRKCPFDHTKLPFPPPFPNLEAASNQRDEGDLRREPEPPFTQKKNPVSSTSPPQPTFVNPTEPIPNVEKSGNPPQMVFNISGPVFIGYPMEQAIAFMQRFQGS